MIASIVLEGSVWVLDLRTLSKFSGKLRVKEIVQDCSGGDGEVTMWGVGWEATLLVKVEAFPPRHQTGIVCMF